MNIKQRREEQHHNECKDIMIENFTVNYRKFYGSFDYDVYEIDPRRTYPCNSYSHWMMRDIGYEELKWILEEKLFLLV